MSEAASAILRSWSFDPWLIAPAAIVIAIYARGWAGLHRQSPERFARLRLASFIAGIFVLLLATVSPIDAFGAMLLQVHMTQHLLLALVAPPFLLFAYPGLPMLRGLPATVRRVWLGPVLASPTVRRVFARVTHPAVCWLAFVLSFWVWHLPELYDLSLRSPAWHRVEHLFFAGGGLLFWWPVVQPYPFTSPWPRWTVVPYLLLASVQNTIFSAIFAFSDRVFYASYASAPRIGGMSAMADQAAAGAIMWVPGSIIMLVPVAFIVHRLAAPLSLRLARPATALAVPAGASLSLPVLAGGAAAPARPRVRRPERPFDLLAVPGVGHVLRTRAVRQTLRGLMLVAAALVVADGLFGPQAAPMNLAGTAPWIHWRGLVVIALLLGANFFCMVCPFMLPRALGRRLLPAGRDWPRRLRSKWLAVGLVVAYLCAYEVLGLWATPWWTAWIIIGYFVAAFAVDGIFKGASFCKYVCPIGQFHFVSSMISPLEVKVRDTGTCATCATRECIRGNGRVNGCETRLFQPKKVGNIDCTFCLDCVSACPHDNIGMLAAMPGTDLMHDRSRSSIGRLSQRPDIAALVIVLVFGGFVNAAGMVGPVVSWIDRVAGAAGMSAHRGLVVLGLLLVMLLAVPAVVVGGAGALGRRWSRSGTPWRDIVCRFTPTLIPIGFAMWFAHMVFHLVTSAGSIVPVIQRAIMDVGVLWLGNPIWRMSCCALSPSWLVPLEIAVLGAGMLGSIIIAWSVALDIASSARSAARLTAPWALVAVLLYSAGVWIIFQPMEMRGMMLP